MLEKDSDNNEPLDDQHIEAWLTNLTCRFVLSEDSNDWKTEITRVVNQLGKAIERLDKIGRPGLDL